MLCLLLMFLLSPPCIIIIDKRVLRQTLLNLQQIINACPQILNLPINKSTLPNSFVYGM